MLSPKARNRVTASLGGSVTVTLNEQVSVRCLASATKQLTSVVPGLNVEPLTGVQTGPARGADPPATPGGGYGTVIGTPSEDKTEMALGQVSLGAPGSTVGMVGGSLHAGNVNSVRTAIALKAACIGWDRKPSLSAADRGD
jgi:hypothetical protein